MELRLAWYNGDKISKRTNGLAFASSTVEKRCALFFTEYISPLVLPGLASEKSQKNDTLIQLALFLRAGLTKELQ